MRQHTNKYMDGVLKAKKKRSFMVSKLMRLR